MENHEKNEIVSPGLNIVYSAYAWKKMFAYIKEVDGEVSGLGRATLIDPHTVYVTDVFIWKQKCGATHTEVIDHDATFSLFDDLVGKGIPPEEICVWWHSHNDFATFFSGTDRATIEEWVNDRFLVAVCGNKKQEVSACIAVKRPFYALIEKIPVSYEIDDRETEAKKDLLAEYEEAKARFNHRVAEIGPDLAEIRREVDEKVQIFEPVVSHYSGFSGVGAGFYTPQVNTPALRPIWEYISPSPQEKADLETAYAENCYCRECIDLLNGKEATFNYDSHYWDARAGCYLSLHSGDRKKLSRKKSKELEHLLKKAEAAGGQDALTEKERNRISELLQ